MLFHTSDHFPDFSRPGKFHNFPNFSRIFTNPLYVCLSGCISKKPLRPSFTNFFVQVTCGRSSSLSLTTIFHILGQANATPIGRTLKVIHQWAELGTKSNINNCLVLPEFAVRTVFPSLINWLSSSACSIGFYTHVNIYRCLSAHRWLLTLVS